MRKICSGMMISTPRTISKLDSMKPSSKIASRMCSSYFLSLGLCFCSKSPILPLVARNWLKKPRFPDSHGQATRPCGSASCPCESKRCVPISSNLGFPHGQGRTTVRDLHPARACSRQKSHGHNCELHGHVVSRNARAASLAPRHVSDSRTIDPKLAPKPPFTY
ncbi:unnamed protein product [Linum trigynum]|uniref:Uncharacterized protein n=1 Tax=Linum trigynum TaxID=586398 RepID=A0AAV2D9F9_9ROSI